MNQSQHILALARSRHVLRAADVRAHGWSPQLLLRLHQAGKLQRFARGLYGQVIHVDPARQLVVAINSATPDLGFGPATIQARVALINAIRAAVDAEPQTALEPR